MKYLLHIDTSTDNGVAALGGDGALIAIRSTSETRNHASVISNMISEVIAEAAITLGDIDGFVVCGGPGSYTGLRIGLATAKGFCYALDKPLFLDNRLTLLAYQQSFKKSLSNSNYLSLLKARDNEYYAALYDHNFNCMLAPQHLQEEYLKNTLLKYENISLITDLPSETISELGIIFSEANYVSQLDIPVWINYALEQYKCNRSVTLSSSEPFYLKQVYIHK
jgi:tRNA threonylcarbamoyladenosine biosynthesis protein TsaB